MSYMKVVIPDCFNLNFTNLVIRYGKSDGSVDYEIPYKIVGRNNQFFFTLKHATNFSIIPVLNPDLCSPVNRYFNLYNYEDSNLTNMIFKTEDLLEPALGCLNDCESCKASNKSYCTSCIQPLLS